MPSAANCCRRHRDVNNKRQIWLQKWVSFGKSMLWLSTFSYNFFEDEEEKYSCQTLCRLWDSIQYMLQCQLKFAGLNVRWLLLNHQRSPLSWNFWHSFLICKGLKVEQGLTSRQTHERSYQGRVLTGHMTQPTVSKHWRKIGS